MSGGQSSPGLQMTTFHVSESLSARSRGQFVSSNACDTIRVNRWQPSRFSVLRFHFALASRVRSSMCDAATVLPCSAIRNGVSALSVP